MTGKNKREFEVESDVANLSQELVRLKKDRDFEHDQREIAQDRYFQARKWIEHIKKENKLLEKQKYGYFKEVKQLRRQVFVFKSQEKVMFEKVEQLKEEKEGLFNILFDLNWTEDEVKEWLRKNKEAKK